MADLHKIVATLKDSLASGTHAEHPRDLPRAVPSAPSAHRAQLASQFARELEAVAGRFLGTLTFDEATAKIVDVARERNARLVAIGEGVVNDATPIADALSGAGMVVVRPDATTERGPRVALRDRIARSDLGIAEAHYAIASTGTLAVLSNERRPSSLTLLPPHSLVLVHVDRLLPDLASALAALGPQAVAENRVTLITGPSRTADIEKRIVLGVHGPKSLDVIVVWPRE